MTPLTGDGDAYLEPGESAHAAGAGQQRRRRDGDRRERDGDDERRRGDGHAALAVLRRLPPGVTRAQDFTLALAASYPVGKRVPLTVRVTFAGVLSPTTATFIGADRPAGHDREVRLHRAGRCRSRTQRARRVGDDPGERVGYASKVRFSIDGATCSTTAGGDHRRHRPHVRRRPHGDAERARRARARGCSSAPGRAGTTSARSSSTTRRRRRSVGAAPRAPVHRDVAAVRAADGAARRAGRRRLDVHGDRRRARGHGLDPRRVAELTGFVRAERVQRRVDVRLGVVDVERRAQAARAGGGHDPRPRELLRRVRDVGGDDRGVPAARPRPRGSGSRAEVVRVDRLDADLVDQLQRRLGPDPAEPRGGGVEAARGVRQPQRRAELVGQRVRWRRTSPPDAASSASASASLEDHERRAARAHQPLVARRRPARRSASRPAAASRSRASRRSPSARRGASPPRRSRRGRRARPWTTAPRRRPRRRWSRRSARPARSSGTTVTSTPRSAWARNGNSSEVNSGSGASTCAPSGIADATWAISPDTFAPTAMRSGSACTSVANSARARSVTAVQCSQLTRPWRQSSCACSAS